MTRAGTLRSLGGKVAVVTGAAAGIGRAICSDRFYLCTENPAEYVPRDERVRRRLENILACRHPGSLHRR